jgi:hypothetical protein
MPRWAIPEYPTDIDMALCLFANSKSLWLFEPFGCPSLFSQAPAQS